MGELVLVLYSDYEGVKVQLVPINTQSIRHEDYALQCKACFSPKLSLKYLKGRVSFVPNLRVKKVRKLEKETRREN